MNNKNPNVKSKEDMYQNFFVSFERDFLICRILYWQQEGLPYIFSMSLFVDMCEWNHEPKFCTASTHSLAYSCTNRYFIGYLEHLLPKTNDNKLSLRSINQIWTWEHPHTDFSNTILCSSSHCLLIKVYLVEMNDEVGCHQRNHVRWGGVFQCS